MLLPPNKLSMKLSEEAGGLTGGGGGGGGADLAITFRVTALISPMTLLEKICGPRIIEAAYSAPGKVGREILPPGVPPAPDVAGAETVAGPGTNGGIDELAGAW